MQASRKDFKVAIVGGGLCGLVCAIGLVKADIHVEVFEAAPKFEEVGAGVGLGPNAIFALEQLGVLPAVLARADERMPTKRPFRFLSGVGTHGIIYDYPFATGDLGLGIYRKARPAFLEALMPMIDSSLVHFNARCVSLSTAASGSHVLHFAGASSYEADLVIGADGIKSVVRNFVSRGSNGLAYSNTVAYRAVVPSETLELAGVKTDLRSQPLCWVGPDKACASHIITFPIQGRRLINIVAFSTNSQVPVGSVKSPSPWVHPTSEDELLREYSGWGNDVIIMLKQIRHPNKWYIHFLNPPLSSYVRERVVLVGDAAHAMLPHLGAGVGQGFEDVYTLCALLGDTRTSAHHLDLVLKAYDKVRVPRANMVLEMSVAAGDIYEGRGKAGSSVSEVRSQLRGLWEPIWHHDLVKDIEGAISGIYDEKAFL